MHQLLKHLAMYNLFHMTTQQDSYNQNLSDFNSQQKFQCKTVKNGSYKTKQNDSHSNIQYNLQQKIKQKHVQQSQNMTAVTIYTKINKSQQHNAKINNIEESSLKRGRPYFYPMSEREQVFCNCGRLYSCTSALYLHIRKKHNGIPPEETKNGHKNILDKTNQQKMKQKKLKKQPFDPKNYIRNKMKDHNQLLKSNYSSINQQSNLHYIFDDDGSQPACNLPAQIHSIFNNTSTYYNHCQTQKTQKVKSSSAYRNHQASHNYQQNKDQNRKTKYPRNSLKHSQYDNNYQNQYVQGQDCGNRHQEHLNDNTSQYPIYSNKCSICGKSYSCTSSLNLHLRTKHGNMIQHFQSRHKNRRKKIMFQRTSNITQENQYINDFKCDVCGLRYGTISSLNLHKDIKHPKSIPNLNNKQQTVQQRYNIDCCGLVYKSRNSFNNHVKYTHNGIYPFELSQPLNKKQNAKPTKIHNNDKADNMKNNIFNKSSIPQPQNCIIYDDSDIENDKKQHLYKNKENRQAQFQKRFYKENKHDNQVEGKQQNEDYKNNENEQNQQQISQTFKCGCGRFYSCSSSLNVHIKRNHNFQAPPGTIGGPRGVAFKENNKKKLIQIQPLQRVQLIIPQAKLKPKYFQKKSSKNLLQPLKQTNELCSICMIVIQGSFYKCQKCPKHYMCSKCFWQANKFSDDHQWISITY